MRNHRLSTDKSGDNVIADLLDMPGKHCDGAGLYLEVAAPGQASWMYRHKARWASVGSANVYTIREARETADKLWIAACKGEDPIAILKSLRQPVAKPMGATFGEWLAKYLDKKETHWSASNRARERRDHERTFAQLPEFTALPVSAIDPAAKADALDKLGLSARRKATSWIEAIIEFSETGIAIQRGGTEEVEHHEAMPYAQVPGFYAGLAALENEDARALRFLILTGARTDEVIGAKHKVPATWSEIVLVDGLPTWVLPASRMKGRKVHRVPLTQAMVALLGPRGKDNAPLFRVSSARGMLSTLKANGGNGFTVHGFRASFSDFVAHETDFGADLADMCIAHETRGKVRKAYQRSDLLKRRRELMERWAAFCSPSVPA
jgi:integrase